MQFNRFATQHNLAFVELGGDSMIELICNKPDWLSKGELLDLPCGCEEAFEECPCAECPWLMPVEEDCSRCPPECTWL